jgi:hypothetical protein
MSDRARAGSDPANRGGSRAARKTRAEHGAGGTEGRQRLRSPRPDAALLGGGKPGRDAAVDQPSGANALGGAGTRCGHCWGAMLRQDRSTLRQQQERPTPCGARASSRSLSRVRWEHCGRQLATRRTKTRANRIRRMLPPCGIPFFEHRLDAAVCCGGRSSLDPAGRCSGSSHHLVAPWSTSRVRNQPRPAFRAESRPNHTKHR